MKKLFPYLPLSLLLTVSAASPALADSCKKIHATIVDVQVTEGCTSPNRFCAAGTVEGVVGVRNVVGGGDMTTMRGSLSAARIRALEKTEV